MKKLICLAVAALSLVASTAFAQNQCEFGLKQLIWSSKNQQQTMDVEALSSHPVLVADAQAVQDSSINLARLSCKSPRAESVSSECEFAIQQLISASKSLQQTLDVEALSSHPVLVSDAQAVLDSSLNMASFSCSVN